MRWLIISCRPAFNGYSAGRWDGDTLVVQTIGFREGTWLELSAKRLVGK
jgi:hypothetical protein